MTVVVPALLLIASAVRERVYQRATEDLEAAGTPLGLHWLLQDDALLNEARAIALEPRLAAAVRASASGRIDRILRARGIGEGRTVLVVDSAARTLVGPALDSTALLRPTLDLAVQRGGAYVRTVVAQPEDGAAPLRVALWPVVDDSGAVVGIVGVGTRLADRAALDMEKATRNQVALVVGDSLVATTLDSAAAAQLPAGPQLRGLLRRDAATWNTRLGNLPYLMRVSPLPGYGLPTTALLLRPVQQELRVASGIQQSLWYIGLASLVLALILAGVLARIVARPVQGLAEAAAHMARGDFRAPLPRVTSDEIGQLTGTFAEMRSAIAEREARLRSAQADLIHREKLAAMGRLVAQLSHEINNPIYNIQNCLEALERRGDPSDPNRQFLELAQEELSRMAVLTRQLLDQSRPLSDAATSLDLNGIVRRVLKLAADDLRRRAIRLETDLMPDLPDVVAHPDAIQQVLANLVANAGDAMPAGGVLRIRTGAGPEWVEVQVEDTGSGIAPEHLPHIFDAFYTTKPEVRGIGLGLFVSDGIIRGHRGQLLASSRPGEGSRFTIRLPLETLSRTFGEPRHVAYALHTPAGQ